jgi:group I intron endonuclease
MVNSLYTETPDDLSKIGVYTITNLINGKMYVGSTNHSFYERWRQHKKALKNGKHHSGKLQNSVNKYGLENFKFEVLEITEKEHTTSIEKYWMNLLDSVKLGYNVSYSVNGGCLGYKFTDEYKANKSKTLIGNKHRLNIKHSDEIKAQIKESTANFYKEDNERVRELKEQRRLICANLNRTKINLLKKIPIIQLDITTNEPIKEWDSASDIGIAFGVDSTSFTQVCRGKGKTAYGFKWKYKIIEK